MTIRTKKPTPSYKDYNRKPYMEGEEGDYNEMMRGVTDKAMFNQRFEPQSEFKKPYLSDMPYEEMEHYYPPPFSFSYIPFDWKIPAFPGPVPSGGEWDESIPAELQGCSIFCVGNGGNRDCGKPAWCKFSRVYPDRPAEWKIVPNRNGETPAIGKIVEKNGKIYFYPPNGSWETDVPDGKESFWLKVMLDQGDGITCTDEVIMYCSEDCCPAEVTFEFDDDNTPNTIAAGNNISVYVLGGCAPFTYAVSGTGYTWNGNGASSYESDNRNEQLDCAAGT